ncbi:HAD family hydrolase [Virgibacillus flavescens]|uniref:HAD family hydrolase n=1 Tax=Virgibacillus flavescens TaxID=1611422 RepID=UPI003D342944
MIKAVVFDLDGTLLDRDQSVKHFINLQYSRMFEILKHIPKEAYATRFIELDDHGYVWKDKVYQQMVEEFKIALSWELLLADYISEFKLSCIPFPGLINMLKSLKQNSFSLGIITNGRSQFQLDNITALGIEKYFDTILISESEGIKKPDPKIFEKALSRLNVHPHESIFIGDHPEKDIMAARTIGMKTIWKKNNQWNDAEPDYNIESLTDIPSIIEKGANQ